MTDHKSTQISGVLDDSRRTVIATSIGPRIAVNLAANNAMPSIELEFSLGEIEAGIVFAAAAAEYRLHDSVIAETCRADAEHCYSAAMKLLRDCEVPARQQHYLKLRLDQLRKQLDRLAGDAAA